MTMRMITCCPACSTLFKVAPDQLQIAGGWVRCGQCMAVFDARERMLPADSYVPPDSDWQGQDEESDATPPSGLAGDAGNSLALAAANQAAPNTKAMAPESRSGSPAAGRPALAAPAFELAPPPAPEKPQAAPVSTGKSPARTAAPEAPAADPARDKAAEPALSIPTRDELDQRHAKLLETLARLRENAERNKNQPEELDTLPPGDDDPDPPMRSDRQGSLRRVWREALERGANRYARLRAASEDEKLGHEHKRGSVSRLRGNDQHAASDSQPWFDQESDEDLSSRPMIDFVLSEIGPSLSASAPFQAEPEPEPEPEPEVNPPQPSVPSFVEQARRRAFWALPLVRAGLWLATVALVLTLAVQIAVSQRDLLAAQYPSTAPLLRMLCRPFQCRIEPWRHLSAVAIDSSAFVRLDPNSFHFAITLRNNSAAPVATPALELALIDVQSQPLARRVLNPADWGAPTQLAAYGEFNGMALLAVSGSAYPQTISNYQLRIFFP